MLSERLKAIADMIDVQDKVIDIGCDHGLLDIYLTKYKNISCTASDINQNALNMAIANIKKYKLDIQTVLSDGLDNLNVDDNTVIVISGMGTNTILKILENKKSLQAKKIIIQSNNNLYDLRKEITKKFKIINEIAIYERKKYYVIIQLEKGHKKYTNFELYFGPIILKNNNNYLNYIIEKETTILNHIPKKYMFLRMKKIYYLKKLKKYIK